MLKAVFKKREHFLNKFRMCMCVVGSGGGGGGLHISYLSKDFVVCVPELALQHPFRFHQLTLPNIKSSGYWL